jgi:hypothetical protein
MNKYKIAMILLSLLAISCRYKEIEEHRGLTTGKIIDYSTKNYRGGGFELMYEYQVNGVKYNNDNGPRITPGNWKYFKEKFFSVVYSTINPEKSIIIVYPDDFKRWGYVFPDSLDWVIDKYGF